jgi:hypothetical protein
MSDHPQTNQMANHAITRPPPQVVVLFYWHATYSVSSNAMAIATQQESQALLPGSPADEIR